MYRLEDERAAIREIQKYLHFVSDRITTEVPRIAIDGVYGDETKAAVEAFQKYRGINVSGKVNYETFTMLYEDFLKAESLYNAENYVIDTELFPFKFGDFGNEVLYLNLMLDEIFKVYTDIAKVELKPYFSRDTEKAVRDVRNLFLLGDSSIIDLVLYDRMRYELEIRGSSVNT